MKVFYFFILFFLISASIYVIATDNHKNPEHVIETLEKGIEHSKEQGNYKCCIEPDCKMCYLGNWKFDKGTCFCDDAIAEGNDELVCPECKKGLEEGTCSSVKEECEV